MYKYLVILLLRLFAELNHSSPNIEIQYLGHSAFVLQFDDISVVTDYGKANAWKEWGWDNPIFDIGNVVPDIMTYSHKHEDHYDADRIPKGVKFILLNGKELDYKGLKIRAIPSCEDKFGEFNNTSYLFSYKGYNILHTGDIQTMIANIETDSIAQYFKANYPEKIDVFIMPIEGKIKYIPQTDPFIQFIHPKVLIPAHFWGEDYLNSFEAHLALLNHAGSNYFIQHKQKYTLDIIENSVLNSINIIILQRSAYN